MIITALDLAVGLDLDGLFDLVDDPTPWFAALGGGLALLVGFALLRAFPGGLRA